MIIFVNPTMFQVLFTSLTNYISLQDNRRKFYRDNEEQCYQKLKWISVLRGSTEFDYPSDTNVF